MKLFIGLSVIFSALIYVNGFYAIPAIIMAVLWAFERSKQELNLQEQINLLQEARAEYINTMDKNIDLNVRITELEEKMDALRTTTALRFK